MIKPTIGRMVWFHQDGSLPEDQPNAAIVAYVHSDRLVNLTVCNSNGKTYAETSVLLYQGDTDRPASRYCEWMPYQQGQAAKTEALEKQLAEK